jgi:hypothetical protein
MSEGRAHCHGRIWGGVDAERDASERRRGPRWRVASGAPHPAGNAFHTLIRPESLFPETREGRHNWLGESGAQHRT